MTELHKMIIEVLCLEYSIEDATSQVKNANILKEGNNIKVVYDNGIVDYFKIITEKKLKIVSNQ